MIAAVMGRVQPSGGQIWARDAIETDIAAFKQKNRLLRAHLTDLSDEECALSAADLMRPFGRMSERAALNLLQNPTKENSRDALVLLSIGASSAARVAHYRARARAGKPPRARSEEIMH
ncbi:hypothetical protein [Roseovarius sp. A-2]|uniref:hypothetical protein n=1 Tax=Roseovarius sp. A-2 TaxID=1570360 RepID=UPI001118306E|nr:hypothetical protein [Roseovarius sp. A-2]